MMWRKTGRTRSAETCLTALNSFKRFRKHADLGYDEVTSDLVQRYESYLKEQGLCRNTSSFYIRQFRTCYNLAVEQGLTADRHPFRHVYTGVDKTAKRALRQEDMSRIYRMDLSGLPQAAFARDIFMFSFFTRGMSFVDMAYLKKSDVSDSTLTYRRRKTGQTLSAGHRRQVRHGKGHKLPLAPHYARGRHGTYPVRKQDAASKPAFEENRATARPAHTADHVLCPPLLGYHSPGQECAPCGHQRSPRPRQRTDHAHLPRLYPDIGSGRCKPHDYRGVVKAATARRFTSET